MTHELEPPGHAASDTGGWRSPVGWLLAAAGLAGLIAAAASHPEAARSAAAQDWPPFVLVTGLLLIGLVADDDGLFAVAGHLLARAAPSGIVLFSGAVVVVGTVTAVLNLDTSVAFLTPVLIYAARSRGEGEAPLLYACLLCSNAGSLFLPGSNLTNLIVLGHLHLTGGQFLTHMWAPALGALAVTAAVIATAEHRSLRVRVEDPTKASQSRLGLGLVAGASAAVLVVVLRNPAIPVAVIGVLVVAVRSANGRDNAERVMDLLDLPVLVGLFGFAVALGTLGRAWSGPADLLGHLDRVGTAAVAAVSSVVVNSLPVASLLAARRPVHRILAAGRTQPRTEPVRDRLPRVDAMAQSSPHGRHRTLHCQGRPAGNHRSSALNGRSTRDPRAERPSLNTRNPHPIYP